MTEETKRGMSPWEDMPAIPEPDVFEDETSIPRLKEIIRALQADGRRAFVVEQQGELGEAGSRVVFTYVVDNEIDAYNAIAAMLRQKQYEDPEVNRRVEEYAGTAYSAAFLLDKFIVIMRALVGALQTGDEGDRGNAMNCAIRLLSLWDSDPDTAGMRAWVKICAGYYEAQSRGDDVPRFMRVPRRKASE